VKEKLYTIAGKEFGPTNEGHPVMIVRALDGLRSSRKSFQDPLAKNLKKKNFEPIIQVLDFMNELFSKKFQVPGPWRPGRGQDAEQVVNRVAT
jgi:hypothetical protein